MFRHSLSSMNSRFATRYTKSEIKWLRDLAANATELRKELGFEAKDSPRRSGGVSILNAFGGAK